MPELPDVTLYVEALRRFVVGRPLVRLRIVGPSVLRTVDPPAAALAGRRVEGAERLGKRIVLAFEDDLLAVIHLMVAGRLHWLGQRSKLSARAGHAAFEFEHGSLQLTEVSPRKRASLHLLRGRTALAPFRPEGVEPLDATFDQFRAALTRENHTVKRALTDPRVVSGVGNAYSDEILHRACLSPVTWTSRLGEEDLWRLYDAARDVLTEWIARLSDEVGDGFPEKVTAFRDGFAVHGRYRKPCPVCGTPVQRIVHAENEFNYCPKCQTGGKLLADLALSRLFRSEWPATLEEMEERQKGA